MPTPKNPLPSRDELRAIFDYDIFTGHLTWRWRDDVANCINRRFAGRRAGAVSKHGARVVRINDVLYQEHRVIWKWVYDEDPDEVDHRFGDPSDNRIWLLREATRWQNMRNVKARGKWPKGVTFDKSRALFAAKIRKYGKTYNLGRFETPEEAHEVYKRVSQEMFGAFACFDR